MSVFKNVDIKKAASWVGSLLMLVSLGFIARRIFMTRGDVDFSVFVNPVVLVAMLSVALLEGVGIILASVNYRAIVHIVTGIKVRWPLITRVYTVSNLYKYIPGGVMYVLGRNQIAIQSEDLSHAKVAVATVLEGITIAVAAIFIAVAFSFEHSMYYLRRMDILPLIGLIVIIIAAVLVPIVYNNRHRIGNFFNEVKSESHNFRAIEMIKRLLFAFVLMVLWAFTFLATLMLFGQPMTLSLGITVMGLYMLSWLAGFLTPGAPSGLGVREAVMVMFMAGTVNEGMLISAMFMHRLLTVIGDVSAYGMALVFFRDGKKEERVV